MRHQWNPIAYSTTFRGEAHYDDDSVREAQPLCSCVEKCIGLSFHQNEKKQKKKKETNRYKHVRRGHTEFFLTSFFSSQRFIFNSVNGLSFVKISGKNSERRIWRSFSLANPSEFYVGSKLNAPSFSEKKNFFIVRCLKPKNPSPSCSWKRNAMRHVVHSPPPSSVFIQFRESKNIPMRVNCCARFEIYRADMCRVHAFP